MAWNPQIGIYNWVGNEGNKALKVYFYKKNRLSHEVFTVGF